MSSVRQLLVAALVSAAVILLAPFMGQIRASLRAAFPDRFVVLVAGGVLAAGGAAVLIALVRIRERRARRYGGIASACGLAVLYSLAFRTGVAEVDVVERVHFVEYGRLRRLPRWCCWCSRPSCRQSTSGTRLPLTTSRSAPITARNH